jgi:hemerythrin-like metal-binding protein
LGRHEPHCIDPLIQEIISYTNYHFSAEEQHMKNIGYKDIDKHIVEHREFTKRILQLQQVADKDEHQVKKELIALLGDWLLHHIIKENKIYTI